MHSTQPHLYNAQRLLAALAQASTMLRQAAVDIEVLREQATTGEMVLAHVDEVGFSQVHPSRAAWTPVGECHFIDAKRDEKRLNAPAAMFPNGGLFSARLWQTTPADLFVGFLALLKKHVAQPLTVIFDTAKIYAAKNIRPVLKLFKAQGATLDLLPSYSRELSRSKNFGTK